MKTLPEHITFGFMCAEQLAPVAMIHAAADGGFRSVGLRLTTRYVTDPDMGLVGSHAAIDAIGAAARERGVRISNISSYYMRGDVTLAHYLPVLDGVSSFSVQ